MFLLAAVLENRVILEASFLIGSADFGVTKEARTGLANHHRRLPWLKKWVPLMICRDRDALSAKPGFHASFRESARDPQQTVLTFAYLASFAVVKKT